MKKLFTLLAITLVTYFTVSAQVSEDFETLDGANKATVVLDGWINYAEAGTKVWYSGFYNGNNYAQFNPYGSKEDSNIGWLITPKVNLDELPNDSLKFDLAYGYFSTNTSPLAIKYSLDFDGKEADISKATWIDITDKCVIPTSSNIISGKYTPFLHTAISIEDLSGKIYIAFIYTGSSSATTAVELDNLVVGNPKPQSKISSFNLMEHQLSTTKINPADSTITITVYPGTDVTSLMPEIEVSKGASVSPASGSAQNFTSPVVYTVTSSDGASITPWTVTVNVLSSTPTPIHDLEFVSDPATSDVSAYAGKLVFTTGVVTYGTGSGSGYIQSGEGEWNGIYVYVGSSVKNVSLNKGDSILIYGGVSEYYYTTEFVPDSIVVITDRKSVKATTTTAPISEGFEGGLIEIEDLVIKANGDNAYFGIPESGDTVQISNSLFSGLALTQDSTYNIAGIVTSYKNAFTLCPRSSSDIEMVNKTSVNTLSDAGLLVYPNPVADVLFIKGASSKNVTIMNLTGTVVQTLPISDNRIDVSFLSKGMYLLSIDSKVKRFVKE